MGQSPGAPCRRPGRSGPSVRRTRGRVMVRAARCRREVRAVPGRHRAVPGRLWAVRCRLPAAGGMGSGRRQPRGARLASTAVEILLWCSGAEPNREQRSRRSRSGSPCEPQNRLPVPTLCWRAAGRRAPRAAGRRAPRAAGLGSGPLGDHGMRGGPTRRGGRSAALDAGGRPAHRPAQVDSAVPARTDRRARAWTTRVTATAAPNAGTTPAVVSNGSSTT
jgi:hypothetical protein